MIAVSVVGASSCCTRSPPPAIVSWNRIVLNDLFLHLIDTLSLPLDERGARRALRDFAEEAGFSYFAYLYLKGPETFVVSNYPREWQALYLEKNYLRIDPVVTNAKHGPPLHTWSGEDARRLGRRAVNQFFSDATRFGICSGLSVSVPVGFRDRMVFTLAGAEPRVHVEGGIDPVTAAVAVAFVHSRLAGARSDASLAADIKLSPREAECLRWFAEGVSMPDIAVMLDISARSVRSYIDEATRKLGAANNRQAGTIATRMGLI
ncbi:MAG: autoinducer binding domain-containing protein [Geminicoccaceae bacterium]